MGWVSIKTCWRLLTPALIEATLRFVLFDYVGFRLLRSIYSQYDKQRYSRLRVIAEDIIEIFAMALQL